MPRKATHYLRNARREAALTQADIAALLAAPWKSRVSRYEQRRALPSLETALVYETVTGRPISELFAPMHRDVTAKVRTRARHLLQEGQTPNTLLRLKRKRSLERIAAQ